MSTTHRTVSRLSARELDDIHQAHWPEVTYVINDGPRAFWRASCTCGVIDPQKHTKRAQALDSHAGHVHRVIAATLELRAYQGSNDG